MILVPDHGLVLLLPWKCASQTLGARLAAVDRSPYPEFYAANPHLNRVTHQHLVLADFVCLPESRLGLDLAVFVRNPYDRVYSGFMEIQRQIRMAPHLPYPAPLIRELVLEAVAINHARVERAGRDVNAWFQHLPEHEILDVGRNSSLPLQPATIEKINALFADDFLLLGYVPLRT